MEHINPVELEPVKSAGSGKNKSNDISRASLPRPSTAIKMA